MASSAVSLNSLSNPLRLSRACLGSWRFRLHEEIEKLAAMLAVEGDVERDDADSVGGLFRVGFQRDLETFTRFRGDGSFEDERLGGDAGWQAQADVMALWL